MKSKSICRDLPCDQSIAERPRYYARQLITPDDMTLEQDYFRDKLRRHNRLLHGWGVVCGAQVCLVPKNDSTTDFEPWLVRVKAGYVLGPYGDEIILDCVRTVDLRTAGVTGVTGEPCLDLPDPWCSEVFEPREVGDFYVAVKYREVKARPVRVQPAECGCDDTRCEYSRWCDGYEIGILTCCPDSHTDPPEEKEHMIASHKIPSCPPCPEEPWVVLAKVTIGAQGKIEKIDNCECRRMVFSWGRLWWQCEDEAKKPSENGGTSRPIDTIRIHGVETEERELKPGVHEVVIIGEALDRIESISFGPGVGLAALMKEELKLVVKVEVKSDARSGPRSLAYRDRLGNKGEFKDAIFIQGGESKKTATGRRSRRKESGEEA